MHTQVQSSIEADARQRSISFDQELIAQIPQLRALSRSLCRNRQTAEDLARDTLVNAWRMRTDFSRGSNLKAWLFTILRNEFHSRSRNADDWDVIGSIGVSAHEWCADEVSRTVQALQKLPTPQREALILVGAAGCSYREAAQICGIPVGTAKSRASRARVAVAAILESGRRPAQSSTSSAGQSAVHFH